jgi:hypothetical protein
MPFVHVRGGSWPASACHRPRSLRSPCPGTGCGDRVTHRPHQVPFRHPVADRRRHQEDLVTVTTDEPRAHAQRVPVRSDGTPFSRRPQAERAARIGPRPRPVAGRRASRAEAASRRKTRCGEDMPAGRSVCSALARAGEDGRLRPPAAGRRRRATRAALDHVEKLITSSGRRRLSCLGTCFCESACGPHRA